jgi:hypothetical protein
VNQTQYRQALTLLDTLLIDVSKVRRVLPLLTEMERDANLGASIEAADGHLRSAIIEIGGIRDWFAKRKPRNTREANK